MHFVEAKGLLSKHNNLNIYRGCSHGCIYCDARSDCYQMNHEFTDIEVKSNAIELLTKELLKKRDKVIVGTGAMSDPYMHIERTLLYTRKMLEVVDTLGHGVSILTKSCDILRDLDLLVNINKKAKTIVQMTLTTYDEELCKILEPNVSTTKERFNCLMKMKDLGIETVVWIAPILPFINDSMENLVGILNYCKQAQVKGIICFGFGVTLRSGDREYFYENLDKHFAGLKSEYIAKYGEQYELNSPNNDKLYKYFKDFCLENKIMFNSKEIFQYMRTLELNKGYEQLSLF